MCNPPRFTTAPAWQTGTANRNKGTSMARGIPCKSQKKRSLLYSTKTLDHDLGENVTLRVCGYLISCKLGDKLTVPPSLAWTALREGL
jgi:hypothetical protein